MGGTVSSGPLNRRTSCTAETSKLTLLQGEVRCSFDNYSLKCVKSSKHIFVYNMWCDVKVLKTFQKYL